MPHKSKSNAQPANAKRETIIANIDNSSAHEPEPPSGKKGQGEVDVATLNPQQFSSGREVAAAIAKKYDLAIVGGRLLSGSSDNKGASVSLRMFETTMEYLFGKPPSQPREEAAPRPRVIWDIPAPARELIEGDLP